MVPASLRIKREELKPKPKARAPEIGAGFGLAPVSRPAAVVPVPPASASLSSKPAGTDAKFLEFMQTMNELGAFE